MKKTIAVLCLVCAGMLLASCATLTTVFSRGGDSLGKAKKAWSDGKNLEAIAYAIDSVKLDPKLVPAQEFLRDNFDSAMSGATRELALSEGQNDSATMARRVYVYDRLVKINAGMSELRLPFKDPAGTWQWTTILHDYRDQLKAEKARAYVAFLLLGKEEIALGRVAGAKKAFDAAIDDYADEASGERGPARLAAAAACVAYAQSFFVSYDINELKNASDAFNLALRFEPTNITARNGVKLMSSRIADLYVAEGLSEEYKDQTESLKKAAGLYEQALVWNPSQADALWLLPRIKERLADIYYQAGFKQENAFYPAEPKTIIASYREALRWVPDYRDSTKRIYALTINPELDEMKTPLNSAGSELNRLYNRIAAVSYKIDTAVATTSRTPIVGEQARSMNASIERVMKSLAVYDTTPMVSPAVTASARLFAPLSEQMTRAVAKLDSVKKPGVDQLKDSLTAIKAVTDRSKGSVEASRASFRNLTAVYGRLKDCIATLRLESDFITAQRDVEELASALEKFNRGLRSMNGNLDSLEALADALAKSVVIADNLEPEIFRLIPIVKDWGNVSIELDGAMGKKITVDNGGKPVSFTVRQILAGLPPEMKPLARKFEEGAKTVLDPILARLPLKLPPLPHLIDFDRDLDGFSSRVATASTLSRPTADSFALYSGGERSIDETIQKLTTLTGCPTIR